MPGDTTEKPGLQAERTELSWERTAIGFLVISAVVLFRHTGPLAEGRAAVAIGSILLALLVLLIAHMRGRGFSQSARGGRPRIATPTAAVYVVGWSTAGLAALIVVFIALVE